MAHLKHQAEDALAGYFWFSDYSPARRLLDLLGGATLLALVVALLWGIVCALSQASVLGILVLPAAVWCARRR